MLISMVKGDYTRMNVLVTCIESEGRCCTGWWWGDLSKEVYADIDD